jgi:polysaccharide deacetylase 2 family uncharacterized protein YibQ
MRDRFLLPLFAALMIVSAASVADPATPVISIIIDDVGYRHRQDREALELPGPLAFAILPHSPHAAEMSALAVRGGKDVLLHLPMEAMKPEQNRFLGPGGLTFDMGHEEFTNTLRGNFVSVPDAIGVNNHMGSLLTGHAGRMEWLMDFLRANGKFYVDSMTSNRSVAGAVAVRMDVPNLSRDVFLDNDQDAPNIRVQFRELIAAAHRKGTALAIGHPHPETIAVLREELAQLERHGVKLIGLRELLLEAQAPARAIPASLRR